MEVYGKLGYTITENTTTMRLHTGMMKDEQRAKGLAVYEDLFSCFADVVKEE